MYEQFIHYVNENVYHDVIKCAAHVLLNDLKYYFIYHSVKLLLVIDVKILRQECYR